MGAKLVSVAMFMLLPALAGAQQPAKCPGALSEAQLADLVRGSVPSTRVGQLVRDCGIDFEPDEQAIGRLRSAGIPGAVLDAVKAARDPKRSELREEQALWESIRDSPDPLVFEDYLRRYPDAVFAAVARQKLLEEIARRADAAYARQDYAAAAVLYQQLADSGGAAAMTRLGQMYDKGLGLVQSDPQAVMWYLRAAENRNLPGMVNLGEMYAKGRGVAQDDTQAVAWYRKAAERGDAGGMKNLGWMYESGRGVAKDDTQAVAWYRKAADNGDAAGMNNLG